MEKGQVKFPLKAVYFRTHVTDESYQLFGVQCTVFTQSGPSTWFCTGLPGVSSCSGLLGVFQRDNTFHSFQETSPVGVPLSQDPPLQCIILFFSGISRQCVVF